MTQGCIPAWTYDDAFYEALLAGTGLYVKLDPVKGKGLFTRHAVEENAVVFEEVALCCSQNLDDTADGIPVCAHCLRSVETPRRQVIRACGSRRLALELPYVSSCTTPPAVKCLFAKEGCSTTFCSARCRSAADAAYHRVCCRGRMTSAQASAYTDFIEYDWQQDGVDYSDTAIVALRAVSQVVQRHRVYALPLAEAFAPFGQLIKAPMDKFTFTYLTRTTQGEGEDPPSRSKAVYAEEAVSLVRRMFHFSETEAAFFTPLRWSELMGAILLNGQERTPQGPYDALKESLDRVSGVAEEFTKFEKRLITAAAEKSDMDEATVRRGLSESSRGQAVYAVCCLFNHSCEPNVMMLHTSTNDETIQAVAIRPIGADEELFISYIDEGAPWDKRREELLEHYLFHCACTKCHHEAPSSE